MLDRHSLIVTNALLFGAAVIEAAEPSLSGPFHGVLIGMGMGGFVQLRLLSRKKVPFLAVISELGFSAFAAYLMYAWVIMQQFTTNDHVLNALCGIAGMGGGVAIAVVGEKILGWKVYEVPKDGS